MNFMRRNWYYVGGVLFIAMGVALVALWGDMSMLRRLMWMSFMALLVHQFEEYAWPGGFPAIMNIAWQRKEGTNPDRCPLNQQSALFVNVVFAYPFYILPIAFPNLVWLGLAQALFGMGQLGVHGVLVNKKMHSIYNPGMFAVVFLHWPIGICYIYYIYSQGLAIIWMWPVAIAIVALFAFLFVNMPVQRWFNDPNSPYPFSETTMARFKVQEKLAERDAKIGR